ncbi:TPA: ATP-dependent DNA ligase, partial [Candidatus Micrarchaeota archaeon]|nr:ATP-dependent DNA ligase [Candidatus Micrarchaeota archaeon]
MLRFSEVAETFQKLEEKSGRLEMTDILAELLKKAKADEVDRLVYLVQGILAPPYEGVDLGIGEKFAIEAIAAAAGYTSAQVERHYKKSGDLGLTAEELLSKKKQMSLTSQEMDLKYLFSSLLKVGSASGSGSQDRKIKLLTEMLNNSSPLEAKFIVRFALSRLRLGVGDQTILDAISVAHAGDKSLREELERAYNICSDMGFVAQQFYENPKNIKKFKVQPFKPLMPALAERLSSPEQIVGKIGKCGVEAKYDGFRLQCHKKGKEVELYSRKLERMTHMFPDVVEAISKLRYKDLIFEAEALAYNEKAKRYFSFQQTMHRRRKHGIDKASKELPLNLFCFDILYLNGKDLTNEPYEKRRKKL